MHGDRLEFSGFPRPRRFIEAPSVNLDRIEDLTIHAIRLEDIAVPIRIFVRGFEVRLLEVSKVEFPEGYIVTLQVCRGGRRSRVFSLYCKDIYDFINKVRAELIKFRLLEIMLPDTLETITI